MTLQYPPGNAVCLSVSAQQMVGFIRGGKMADCTRVSSTTPRDVKGCHLTWLLLGVPKS